jgi:pseudouridine kinase
MAGLVHGNLRGWGIQEKARFATGASLMALAHRDTINPDISEERIARAIEGAVIDFPDQQE